MSVSKVSVIGLGKLGSEIHKVFCFFYETRGLDKYFLVDSTGNVDYSNLGDVAFVVVPTPSVEDKFSSQSVEEVLEKIIQKQIVSIVSTLYPGETDRLQAKFPHLTLVYNPTFVALGSVEHDFTHPDMVLIGSHDKKAANLVKTILNKVILTKPVYSIMTPLEAEIAKLTLNCYITTKITFANQIGNLCYRVGVSPESILRAVGSDSRVGNKYFKAGLGYGGPCFPRDNLALSAYMRDNGMDSTLSTTVHELNEEQVGEILMRIEKLNPKSVGFKSLSYKEGTDVEECSQIKAIHSELAKKGVCLKTNGDVNISWEGIDAK